MRICQITQNYEILSEEEIIKRSNGNVKIIANRIYNKILNTMQLVPEFYGSIKQILDEARSVSWDEFLELKEFEEEAISIISNSFKRAQVPEFIRGLTTNKTAQSFKMLVQKAEKKINNPESKAEFLAYSFQAYFGFIVYGWISGLIAQEEELDHKNLRGNFENLYDRITHLKDVNEKFLYLSQLIIKYAQRLETSNQPIDIRQIMQILNAKDVQLLALNLERIPEKYQTMLKNETLAAVKQDITNYYKYLLDKYYKTK